MLKFQPNGKPSTTPTGRVMCLAIICIDTKWPIWLVFDGVFCRVVRRRQICCFSSVKRSPVGNISQLLPHARSTKDQKVGTMKSEPGMGGVIFGFIAQRWTLYKRAFRQPPARVGFLLPNAGIEQFYAGSEEFIVNSLQKQIYEYKRGQGHSTSIEHKKVI